MSADGIYRPPLEVLTGIAPPRTLTIGTDHSPYVTKRLTIDRLKEEQVLQIEELQASLLQMHKCIGKLVSRNRSRQLKAHSKKIKIIQPNFTIGGFVLVRKAHDRGHKIKF